MAILHAQYNFANGELDPLFWGRSDLPLYRQCVANGTNVLINDAGGLSKRPGFEAIESSASQAKLIPFIVTGTTGDPISEGAFYLVEITPTQVRVLQPRRDAGNREVAVFANAISEEHVFFYKYAQQGNDLFLTHKAYVPKKLTFRGAEGQAGWALADDSIMGWNDAGNYPGVVSFYKQRKIFASSVNNPRRIGMSQTGMYGNFTVGTDAASPLQVELASDVNDTIIAILPYETFVVFTEAGVWVNDNPEGVTPLTVSFSKRSNVGIDARTDPVILRNNIFYIPPLGNDVLKFEYSERANKYSSDSITKTFRHLFRGKKVINWATSDYHDLILLAFRQDGDTCTGRETVCIKYDEATGLHGATIWDTNGVLSDIQPDGFGTGAYFVVTRERSGEEVASIERVTFDRNIYVDPNDEVYIMGISSLPYEGQTSQLSDRFTPSRLFIKTYNTPSCDIRTSSRFEYDEGVALSPMGASITEVPVQGDWEFDSQLHLRSQNAHEFNLLSFAIDGSAKTQVIVEGKN